MGKTQAQKSKDEEDSKDYSSSILQRFTQPDEATMKQILYEQRESLSIPNVTEGNDAAAISAVEKAFQKCSNKVKNILKYKYNLTELDQCVDKLYEAAMIKQAAHQQYDKVKDQVLSQISAQTSQGQNQNQSQNQKQKEKQEVERLKGKGMSKKNADELKSVMGKRKRIVSEKTNLERGLGDVDEMNDQIESADLSDTCVHLQSDHLQEGCVADVTDALEEFDRNVKTIKTINVHSNQNNLFNQNLPYSNQQQRERSTSLNTPAFALGKNSVGAHETNSTNHPMNEIIEMTEETLETLRTQVSPQKPAFVTNSNFFIQSPNQINL